MNRSTTAGARLALVATSILCGLSALCVSALLPPAHAADAYFKDKQIRLIVGSAPGGEVVTATVSAPAPASASTSGWIIARAVAATVTTIRSGPATAGGLQPNAASCAVQGVSRSICARTTPSRNSVARCGS